MITIARLLLGYALALPFIVPMVVHAAGALSPYTVLVRMTSPAVGHLQVFYDTGAGFSEPRSAATHIHPSTQAVEYQVGLPSGQYTRLRIDPGTLGGHYVIERVAIVRADGSVHAEIPLDALVCPTPGVKAAVVDGRLTLDSPYAPSDQQLIYAPSAPIVVPAILFNSRLLGFFARIAAVWLAAVFVIWLIERALRPLQGPIAALMARVWTGAQRYPRAAVWATALAATIVAVYPVAFFGRSRVSPNNGFVRLLYHEVPFIPGSTDKIVDEVRGGDVGAGLYQSIPHSLIQREALRQGEVPLWNRYHTAGLPLWGQGLTFLLDPLHWLTIVIPDPSIGWDLKLIAHRTVFAAGIGLAALALTGSGVAAVIVAAAAPFVAVYTFRLNHPASFVLTYAPWLFIAWFQLITSTTRRRQAAALVMLVAASALVLVASLPKEAAIVLGAAHGAGLLAVLLSPGTWRRRLSMVAAVALAGVATILITSPHWLIFLDFLRQAFTAYDIPYAILARRSHAVGLFLSPATPGPVHAGLHLLALVLLVAGAMAPKELLKRPLVLAISGVATALLLVAFGAVPVRWLLQIPFVRNIGHLDDVLVTSAVPLLFMLCAAGAVALRKSLTRACLTALVMGLACAWLYINVRQVARDDALEPLTLVLLAPMAIAFPVLLYVAQTRARLMPMLSAAAAALVLVLPGALHLDTGNEAVDAMLIQPRPRPDLLAGSSAIDAIHAASTTPVRTIGLDWTLHSGSQRYYGLEGIGGPDPLTIPSYRELVDAAHIQRAMIWFTVIGVDEVPRLATLLDVLNAGFVLAHTEAKPAGYTEVALPRPDRMILGQRSTAWPRAFFVDGVSVANGAADVLRLAAAAGKPIAAIEAGDAAALAAAGTLGSSSGAPVAADNYRLTVNTTSFHVRAPAAGVAVLTETFLPNDFQAMVNGRPVPYFRVNHAFKGVAIPAAGEWEVTFTYRPRYWTASLVMAGAGLLLLAGIALKSGGW